jgi:multiple sugar transport system ATP-binding protein
MDEPLSNLDALLRVQMRTELLKLHRRVGRTTIYVTHDQIEAMTMADRIVVMRDGVVQQVGTTSAVYSRPANTFVATFVGSPPMNLISGHLATEAGLSRFSGPLSLDLDGLASGSHLAGDVTLGIRPENVALAGPDDPGAIPGRVELIESIGSDAFLSVTVADGVAVMVRVPADTRVQEGEHLHLRFPPVQLRMFDASGELWGGVVGES